MYDDFNRFLQARKWYHLTSAISEYGTKELAGKAYISFLHDYFKQMAKTNGKEDVH
jgi:hypothetical protein